MPASMNNTEDVCDYMEDHMVTYNFRGQPQQFLPRLALEKVTRKEVVQKIVAQDKDIVLNNREQTKLVDQIVRVGGRLFAICVNCGTTMQHLKVMLDNGITDERLPLSKDDFGSLKEKRTFVKGFIGNQKHFNTISFPVDSIQRLNDLQSDLFTIPIDYEELEANRKGKGAFGTVWKVRIHSEHRSFTCETNDGEFFAMKVTPHEGREQDYHRQMAGLNHSHLVKCLASFTLGAKYQMIYELASCDLEEFMRDRPKPSRHPELTHAWLAQQLAGLSGALKVVHNPQGLLNVPNANTTRTGYMHDIKPENILVFIYQGKVCILRLSDFSCAKVVEIVATISGKRDSYKTGSKPGTPTYRAPEISENASSRPYDMWSLGCVFLELLVWYLEGYEALEKFRDSREGSALPNGMTDEGFYHKASTGETQLREPVLRKIDELRRQCQGDLKDIVDVVPSLLKIKPKERMDASHLAARLSRFSTSTGSKSVTNFAGSLTVPSLGSTSLPTYESDSDPNEFIKVTRPSKG
ncbi:kinase-like protein [Karstenula rhodostoma CBS 690.94]|uniref:Kinase-like protein n=1 Tax=Karstenula rhodostoma CBS 690.94 TaxID=1392251 RepID=A0A9P4U9Y3_9PLEO|nr:kinase-like protein [Karstenula rhodostoma CBS 690.94]